MPSPISSEQSRAARALLALTQEEAATACNLALATLKRIETPTSVDKVRPHNITRLKCGCV